MLGELGYEIDERETQTHVDAYFDTSDWSIYRSGWAYRCRHSNGQNHLTLKALSKPQGALFSREEIEQPLPENRLASALQLPAGKVEAQLAKIDDHLERRKLFSVKSRRTAYRVSKPGDDMLCIELDLDRTRIKARRAMADAPGRLEFTELELELESGDPDGLAGLADLLQKRLGLVPAKLSKFERGLHTAGLWPSTGQQESAATALSGDDSVLRAAVSIPERTAGRHRANAANRLGGPRPGRRAQDARRNSKNPRHLEVVVDGIVWYNESGMRPDALVRFDPATETFQSWPIPSGNVHAGIVRHMRPTRDGDLLIHQSSTNRIVKVTTKRTSTMQ